MDVNGYRLIEVRERDAWLVGVDLGKSVDSTAIAVMHHTIKGTGTGKADHATKTWRQDAVQRFDLLHLQRLPLGMNYVAQAHAIGELMQREPLKSAKAKLVIDQSGVGAGVVDLMEANGLRPIRLQITAGSEQTQEGNIYRVAKTILISKLEAAMHSKELHVAAALTEAESLRDELRDFQRHVTASGANTWSARAGKHDDIVLAVSYGIWWATSGPRTDSWELRV
ncbi:hypothetical protein JQ581_02460 [Bradyrhizobium liaoningense]|uniref:hypothetical protein n=1 Tax=Bradyrhizobium liaoningense TaxID=43992 RepID=UPI001BA474BE|nr:hypothetical protein [Bradyrhizobium liaoningense]MBR0735777.1 hypothetical protein [Bradyrhizobium liaoningense]